MSNTGGEPNGSGGRLGTVSSTAKIDIGDIAGATSQINDFNKAIAGLQSTLTKLSQASPQLSSNISGGINKIGSSAGGGGGSFMSGMGNVASSMFGAVNEKGWAKDLLMFPTRYMRSAVEQNRQLAITASAGLGQQAFGANVSTQAMMGALAGQFGNVLGGNPADLVNLMGVAGQVGAGIDWRKYAGGANTGGPNGMGGGPGGPRAGGFFRSVYEAQRMNPGADVGSLAGAIGGYAGNVGAQQQSAFLTGGAFSMIGSGNRQKSISEWADGILKWLVNLRPGRDRGKAFSYGELMSQNFPGSNIDAWLTANGVTADMKAMFWSYAMARSQQATGGTVDDLFTNSMATGSSVAYNRLQAASAQTRTGFRLAGTMAGAYANKEQANQYFAEMTGHMMNQILPAAMSTGLMSYMQYLPDTIEEIMMQMAERTSLGTLGAGVVGWGGATGLLGAGDVGDVGDYGSLGGTSSAGLHPDMRKRVDAMMQANPKLRVTSGFRDLGTQQRLKRQGVGRVSGRPSAHTRGMAADLGPRSQYGWISRNAGRFGLSSGKSHGEPWHVGMGDIGDPLTAMEGSMGTLFSSLFKSFVGGSTPEEQIRGIGGASSWLMQAIMGLFGSQGANLDRLKFRGGEGGVYDQLVAAANSQKGLPADVTASSGGGMFSDLINRAQGMLGGSNMGGGGGGGTHPNGPVGGGGTLDAFFGDVLTQMGYPNTANNRTKLAAIARVEGNKSGTYNPFNSTGGSQFPKYNSAGVRNYPNWSTGVEYTARQLNKSASAVPGGPEMAVMRGNLQGDGTYSEWISDAQGFYRSWKGYSGANLLGSISSGKASEMLGHEINMGDVGDMNYAQPPMPMATMRQAPMIFQNTFKIDGGGAGGGIDVRRTASLLADQLEQQMQQRMARRN